MHFKRRMPHAYLLREYNLLREQGGGIIPLNHLAEVKLPVWGGKHHLQDGEIQVAYLPPSIGRMLILHLYDSNSPAREVDQYPIRLAPTPLSLLPRRKEPQPRGRNIPISIEGGKVVLHLPLIADALEPAPSIVLLPDRGREGEIRREDAPGGPEPLRRGNGSGKITQHHRCGLWRHVPALPLEDSFRRTVASVPARPKDPRRR